jgi:hypothetical protein
MKDTPRTLADTDIASRRAVTRRTLISTLGIGAGLAAVAVAGAHAQTTQPKTPPKEEPKQPPPRRRDPCRDSDHGPSDTDGCGRPPIS